MDLPELKYNEAGLIPCIVQDADTGEVLMMAWMSAESLALTLERGETVFWSRSRRRAVAQGRHEWQHPEAGRSALRLRRGHPARAGASGRPRRHTGERTCFYRSMLER